MSGMVESSGGIAPPLPIPDAEASGSLSPTASGSAVDAARPKRALRPTVKALMAREQSPEGWEHSSRAGHPSRSVRTASGVRPQIKLKMKAGVGVAAAGAGQGSKTQPYMQAYDRELDSEDDETGPGLAFEEQLILRMPEGPECEKLRQAIQKRQLGDDVWFKFKDSRRAVVHVGDALFSAKLVDLPTITESHKTLDSRQFFKIADIAQMLVVEEKIHDESQASSSNKAFNIDDFIYPHGITPPMKWARKRRFRKRTARRAIETVEKEVERLLKVDKKAEQVEYELMDAAEDGGSEEEEEDGGRGQAASPTASNADTPMPAGSDVGSQDEGDEDDLIQDGPRRFAQAEDGYDDGDEVDEDLAAELDAALEEEEDDDEDGESIRGAGSEAQSRGSDQEDLWDDDDEEDGEDGEDDEDEEDDENDAEKERRVREAQLEAECKEIDALVRRKQSDVDSTMNLIIKNRHQQALRKLTVERDMKRNQLADLKQARRERKEEVAAAAAAAAATNLADPDAATEPQDGRLTHEEPELTFAPVEPSQDHQNEAQGLQNGVMAPPALPAKKPASDTVSMDVDEVSHNTQDDQADDLWDDDGDEE